MDEYGNLISDILSNNKTMEFSAWVEKGCQSKSLSI